MPPKLGIIAGGGPMPARLAEACRASGRPCFVIALEGEAAAATVADVPHAWFPLTAVGRILERLKEEGCVELVMLGAVRRPDIARLRWDWRVVRMLPRVLAAAARGDDRLARLIVTELEAEGFRVVGAHTVLETMLMPEGPLGRARPEPEDEADLARGIAIVQALGNADVGQAAIVCDGIVLGVEAIEGTDRLIARCASLKSEVEGRRRGVLVKLPKPMQERRVDLPVIGPTTIANAVAAGLAGIAVEARGTLLVEREQVTEAADAAGLFVIGIRPPPPPPAGS
ncbi:LpxI family protein [Zavarzinia sp. CC-PAN008]|uniref:LpxI family protein n=1 Tax=Zavarzinia sp. CC-PAN008 TaxID=3243332 RepID=UPI003F748ECF